MNVAILFSFVILLRSAQADPLATLIEEMRQCTETGDYSAAGRLLPALLDELAKPQPRAGSGWNQVGVYYHTQHNHAAAENAYLRGIRLIQKEDPAVADHPLLLLNLATVYLQMGGRPAQAEILARRALTLAESLYGSTSPALANFLYTIGAARLQQNDYKEARHYFQRALASVDDTRYSTIRRGAILSTLAVLCAIEKQWIEARDLLLQSIQLMESVLGSQHPDLVRSYLNLTYVYRHFEQWPQAYSSVTRARQITEAHFGSGHPLMIDNLEMAAFILRKSGRTREARDLRRRAKAIAQTLPNDPGARSSIHIADLARSLPY
jgi:tetratricopeptide (TPR) repeat protein